MVEYLAAVELVMFLRQCLKLSQVSWQTDVVNAVFDGNLHGWQSDVIVFDGLLMLWMQCLIIAYLVDKLLVLWIQTDWLMITMTYESQF